MTLVLLPGLDGTGDLFAPLVRALAGSVPTVVVRYPPSVPLGYDELTELALGLLPAAGPFVLLGESFSGPVAIKLAARAPRGLRGVILCVSFARGPRPVLGRFSGLLDVVPMRQLANFVGPPLLMGRYQTPELRQVFQAAIGKVSPAVLRMRLQAAAHVDVCRELGSIRVPSLYLRASEDALVPRLAAEDFARAAVRGKVTVVESPHSMLQCVPDRAGGPIREFVSSVEGD